VAEEVVVCRHSLATEKSAEEISFLFEFFLRSAVFSSLLPVVYAVVQLKKSCCSL
jgi:hypothetical protein